MTVSDLGPTFTAERRVTLFTDGDRERPSRDEIARLAYRLYELRGRRDGHDVTIG